MIVKISDEAKAAIESALRRGHNVEIKRIQNGLVIYEVKKTITYRDSPIAGERKRQ